MEYLKLRYEVFKLSLEKVFLFHEDRLLQKKQNKK